MLRMRRAISKLIFFSFRPFPCAPGSEPPCPGSKYSFILLPLSFNSVHYIILAGSGSQLDKLVRLKQIEKSNREIGRASCRERSGGHEKQTSTNEKVNTWCLIRR